MQLKDEILESLSARRGHFLLESGHHGDLWLDLDLLCLNPVPIRRFAAAIAKKLEKYDVETICGPLIEGAFAGMLAALEMGLPFAYSERFPDAASEGLYPFEYRIPPNLRPRASGRRVAIVNDVINAGSAVRGTFAELRDCGAQPVAVGAILVLGTWAEEFAMANGIRVETLAALPNALWAPSECPICKNNVALSPVG